MGIKRRHWLNDSVIAVDRNFMPMMSITRRHAIKSLVTMRAEVVDLSTWARLAFYELNSFKDFEVIIYPHVTAVQESKITIGRGFRGILDRDAHQCQYCGGRAATIDHVIPKSRGGSNSPGNLVAACGRCNGLKGNRTPDEARMPLLHPIRTFRWNLIERFHRIAEKK